MVKYFQLCMIAIVILCLPLFFLQCDEGDNGPNGGDCGGNNAPELNAVNLSVDGSLIYDGFAFQTGNKVNFMVDYKDIDCNLNGGQVLLNWNNGGFTPISQIALTSPCEGEYPNEYLNFSKKITQEEDIEFSIKISDKCGTESNALYGTFSVGHAPKIMEAYWSPKEITLGEKSSIKLKICDSDSDLFSGDVYLYKHGSLAALMEFKVYHFGLGADTQTDNCYAPPLTSPSIDLLKGECFDISVVDEAGNSSGRYEGTVDSNGDEKPDGFCITVVAP